MRIFELEIGMSEREKKMEIDDSLTSSSSSYSNQILNLFFDWNLGKDEWIGEK